MLPGGVFMGLARRRGAANSAAAAKEYDCKTEDGKLNLVAGANIAGFLKIADAMKWQGIAY